MADYSSLEGIKGILTLLYGEFPSAALQKYAEDVITFNKQIMAHGLELPVMFEFVFNNFTTNSGVATAYEAVKNELINFCFETYKSKSNLFAESNAKITNKASWASLYVADTKDFHTAGKVSAGLGIPLHRLPEHSSYTMPDGSVIGLPASNYEQSLLNMRNFVRQLI